MPAPSSVRLRLTTPVGQIERTSEWGQRGSRYHHGIDLYAPRGTAVRAAARGQVVASVPNGAPGYARYSETIRIEHPDGTETLYAHLDARYVRQGQSVSGGQRIGIVGDTRGSPADPDDRFHLSAPHLHFEVLIGDYPASRGAPDGAGAIRTVNPRAWFQTHGQALGEDATRLPWGWIAGLGVAVAGAGVLVWWLKR